MPTGKSWALLKCKIFIWLALLDHCWTAERLARHGLPHAQLCLFYDQEPESMHHLLVGCSFLRQLWHELLSLCRCISGPPQLDNRFQDWCLTSCAAAPSPSRKGLSSLLLLGAWLLWKHRNTIVFDGKAPFRNSGLANILRE